jgi:CRISPR-associated protein Csb1
MRSFGMPHLTDFDRYLSDDGPAALVIREWIMPAEGPDGVVFPATYAAGNGFPGGYNIDTDPATGKNVALIDSVGSQANRIEPIFKEEKYRHLVPQIVVTAGEKEVSILEAGHRAGDALIRCSSLQDNLREAFNQVFKGNALPLAKIAPTSLVFGVWDSRDTQAKLPRLLASTIRAFNVRPLHRSAQYGPPVDYAALEVFSEEDKAKAEGNTKSPLAQRGFVHVPATWTHGGVIADGGIRRDATLSLAALRQLYAGKDAEQTRSLRRYILGLALVAFTYRPLGHLRQGCLLVLDPTRAKENEFVEVYADGTRKPCDIAHAMALAFADEAAKAFGVGESRTVSFEKEKAKADVTSGDGTKTKPKKGGGKVKASEETDDN